MSKKHWYVCRALIATEAVGLLSASTSNAIGAPHERAASAIQENHHDCDGDCKDGDGCDGDCKDGDDCEGEDSSAR